MVISRSPLQPMKAPLQTQKEDAIDKAIAQWKTDKDCHIFPVSINYSKETRLATLAFENGACYQFNPLHIQEVTLEVDKPTAEQLSDVVIRTGGGSLHWPQLDASIGIDNLLMGRYGTDKWMAHLKSAV